jgi:Tfp pilus assembly protein PilE
LLELMVVVAIVAVLAAIVIPNWAASARNKKYDPEITAMFTEIAQNEMQYKSENTTAPGTYLAAAACPAAPNPNGIDFNATCVSGATPWVTLRVNATDSQIRCSYTIQAGAPGTLPVPPAPCPAVPAAGLVESWYMITATCDMDAAGGTNATFCTTSWDTAQYNVNYGS